MKNRQSLSFVTCFLLFALCNTAIFGQVASRTDGVTVFHYDSLHEAVSASAGTYDQPDEITLLADFVLDEPFIVDDGKHIRLVAGGANRTIHRSGNLIAFPVVWVRGDSASLSLGKPGMEFELIIDGGWLDSPPIEAHCPLVAVSGPDSILIMYDGVTLQNNKNRGSPLDTSYYENGSGVFIRTQGNVTDRQAEFIMKGGTIRGNINDVQIPLACGGGVFVAGFGIFTMEGGVIMSNTARINGGGFQTGSRGSFKKSGGIIYGSNAPTAYRNTALNGYGTPKIYGHAVWVSIFNPSSQFRDDTLGENDNLSYTGVPRGNGIFGKGEKWDNPDKAFRRMLVAVVLPFLVLTVCVFLILRKRYLKKLNEIVQKAADTAVDTVPYINIKNMELSDRENEICELLLTDRPLKEIAPILGLSYTGAIKRSKKLYAQLGIQNRTELLVRIKSGK